MAGVAVQPNSNEPTASSSSILSDDEDDVQPSGTFSLFGSKRIARVVGANQQQSQAHAMADVASLASAPFAIVNLEIARRTINCCVEIEFKRPSGAGTGSASASVASEFGVRFQLAMPPDLVELMRATPFRVMVDRVELRSYTCSDPAASCTLLMERATLLNPEFTTTRAKGMQRAPDAGMAMPLGTYHRFEPPRLVYERRIHLDRTDVQREFRYSQFANTQEIMDQVQFDPKTDRLTAQSLLINGVEPMALVLFKANPDQSMRPEDRSHQNPKREHFRFALDRVDNEYFQKKRAQLFYASQLNGTLMCDATQCKAKLEFVVSLAYSRKAPAVPAAQAQAQGSGGGQTSAVAAQQQGKQDL